MLLGDLIHPVGSAILFHNTRRKGIQRLSSPRGNWIIIEEIQPLLDNNGELNIFYFWIVPITKYFFISCQNLPLFNFIIALQKFRLLFPLYLLSKLNMPSSLNHSLNGLVFRCMTILFTFLRLHSKFVCIFPKIQCLELNTRSVFEVLY